MPLLEVEGFHGLMVCAVRELGGGGGGGRQDVRRGEGQQPHLPQRVHRLGAVPPVRRRGRHRRRAAAGRELQELAVVRAVRQVPGGSQVEGEGRQHLRQWRRSWVPHVFGQ